MPDARSLLTERLQVAFDAVEPGADPVLRPSDRADYQANGALAAGQAARSRARARWPRRWWPRLDLADVCERSR